MDQNKGEVGKVRLFVGGLTSEVSAVDLKERFSPLGTVLSVAVPSAKYGSHRGFAYVDFLPSREASLSKLKSSYNGCKWRGGVLRIEEAKEHYLDKLQKEWTAEAEAEALAAAEAERLRKKNEAPALAVPKQAKSWPLLLLEQPEKSDKWRKKRDFEQGADSDGIKLYFPTLKKVKTVPSRGLGKHKRSFQRVESLPLHELSTCDCEESLRTGSCDCSTPQPGDSRGELVGNGEYDSVSLSIAKERQRQLDLLSKMFPSDSPSLRTGKPVLELKTSLPSNGVASRKGLARVDEDEIMDLQTDDPGPSPSTLRNGEASGELKVRVLQKQSLRSTSEVVEEKSSESDKVLLNYQGEQESTEIEADEPEMWVSFMDSTPLPPKTEENVSEFDLDELELMLSEEEKESEEEEEALEDIPEAPKKKAKRRKKKSKKAKLGRQTSPGNEPKGIGIGGDELVTKLKSMEATPSSTEDEVQVSIPESVNLLLSTREDVTRAEEAAPLAQADESKKHEGETLSSRSINESLDQQPYDSKRLVSDTGNYSPTDVTDSLEDDTEDSPPVVVDRDEFFAGVTSSDESLESDADEQEMWISGINEADSAPTLVSPVNVLSEHPHPDVLRNDGESDEEEKLSDAATSDESMEFEADEGTDEEEESSQSATSHGSMEFDADEGTDEEEESSESPTSDESMESEGEAEDPEIWVSGLGARENVEDPKVIASGDEEEEPDLWVSGLENPSVMPQVSKKISRSKSVVAKASASAGKAEKDLPKPTAVGSISEKNEGELSRVVPMEKTRIVELKDETRVEPAIVVSSSSGKEECGKASQEVEASVPKRNELTRAAWKSLVGETGRVFFSLKQIIDGPPPVTSAADESPAVKNIPAEKSEVSDTAQKKDGTSNRLATNQVDEKLGSIKTPKDSLESKKVVSEVDALPKIPVFADDNVCPFMKSPDAEKEWLAKKADLRTDYRMKHKQALKKSRKLRGR